MKQPFDPKWLDYPRNLELQCAEDWPARENEYHHGWELFATAGRSGRVNSVWPTHWEECSTHRATTSIAWCEDWYRARGLKAMFKLPERATWPIELPDYLTEAGYAPGNETYVMTRMLEGLQAPSHAVKLEFEATPAFIDALRQACPSPEDFAERAEIISRMDENTTFASVEINAAPAAIGLARHSPHFAGLYVMRTPPQARRQGLARDIVRALCRASRLRGASVAFLQVEAGNPGAVALYASEGFTRLYSYFYWTKTFET